MVEFVVRFLKRLAVFLPGVGITYLIIKDVYPVFERRLPVALAILATYIITAYGAIPASIRLMRLISKPKHVPFYSTTPDGFASDPVNIGFYGTETQVIKAMKTIGWHKADPRNLRTLFRLGLSMLLSRPYPNAPFSTLYLLGRRQDLGFELPLDANPRHRHHVRFWAVKPGTAEHFQEHIAFWNRHHPDKNKRDDKYLWLGAASLDTGIGMIRHNAQLTHMVHKNTNAERDLIVGDLKAREIGRGFKTVTIAQPYQLRNRVITAHLEADGKLTICQL